MRESAIVAAVKAGKARARRLTPAHWLIQIPDQSFAAVLLDGTGTRLDWNACGRLSRPAAHRALRLVAAPKRVRDFFERRLDGVPCRVDEAPAFIDFSSDTSDGGEA